jgi:hypothetical protein
MNADAEVEHTKRAIRGPMATWHQGAEMGSELSSKQIPTTWSSPKSLPIISRYLGYDPCNKNLAGSSNRANKAPPNTFVHQWPQPAGREWTAVVEAMARAPPVCSPVVPSPRVNGDLDDLDVPTGCLWGRGVRVMSCFTARI